MLRTDRKYVGPGGGGHAAALSTGHGNPNEAVAHLALDRCLTSRRRATRKMGAAMQGYITGKHLVLCGGTIIRSFGLRCWLRCAAALLSPHPTTFLAIACAPARSRR